MWVHSSRKPILDELAELVYAALTNGAPIGGIRGQDAIREATHLLLSIGGLIEQHGQTNN